MTHGSRFKVTSAKVALVLICVLTSDEPDGERDLLYQQRSEILITFIVYTQTKWKTTPTKKQNNEKYK